MAMNEMKKAHNGRKAILIISDGGDNSSRFTESEVRNWVREGDVQIYSIGIFEPIGSRGRTPEEMSGPGLLSELAEESPVLCVIDCVVVASAAVFGKAETRWPRSDPRKEIFVRKAEESALLS